jgi:hypothetical protein
VIVGVETNSQVLCDGKCGVPACSTRLYVCCFATKRCEEYRRTCTLSDGLESLDRAGESLGVNKVTILIAVYHPFFLSFCMCESRFLLLLSVFVQSSTTGFGLRSPLWKQLLVQPNQIPTTTPSHRPLATSNTRPATLT